MPDEGERFTLSLDWRTTLFALLTLPLLVGLGLWQLQRAQEKAEIAARWQEREGQAPVSLAQIWDSPAESLSYLPVKVSGVFLEDKYFLLDNRIYGGRFGYEVLAIVQLDEGGGLALVNRGWLAADPARLALPAVPPVSGRVELTGHVYIAPGAPYLLAEQELGPGWPIVLQAVEMEKILPLVAAIGGARVFPYPVRIGDGEPGALLVDWQLVNVSPQKHEAYAAQWFTMAAVLLVFFLFRSSNLWQLLKTAGSGKRK